MLMRVLMCWVCLKVLLNTIQYDQFQVKAQSKQMEKMLGDLRSRPTHEDLAKKGEECEQQQRNTVEAVSKLQNLKSQLDKPSVEHVDADVQTDDALLVQSASAEAAAVADAVDAEAVKRIASATVSVQTEAVAEPPPDVASKPPNGFHSHENGDQPSAPRPTDKTCSSPPAAVVVSPFTEQYADDIALLVDPNVHREEELIAFKEQNETLTAANRRLIHQVELFERQRLSGATKPAPVWLVGVLIAIIGYLLVSPYL